MMELQEFREVPQDEDNAVDVVVNQPQPSTSGGLSVVVNQPQPSTSGNVANENWMSVPPEIGSCPEGLEYLAVLDQLLISDCKVWNVLGQKIYSIREESDCSCLGSDRSYDLKFYDNFRKEVLRMRHPCRCNLLCCCPSSDSVEVWARPGQLLGTLEDVGCCRPTLNIKDQFGDIVLTVEGPFNYVKCCKDTNFRIYNLDNEEIGKIVKSGPHRTKNLIFKDDYYRVTFPLQLDVSLKALVLSMAFYIKVIYYETAST